MRLCVDILLCGHVDWAHSQDVWIKLEHQSFRNNKFPST